MPALAPHDGAPRRPSLRGPVLLLLVGCSGGTDAEVHDPWLDRSVIRLELRGEGAPWPAATPEVVHRWRPSPAEAARLEAATDGSASIEVTGAFGDGATPERAAAVMEGEGLSTLPVTVADDVSGIDRLKVEIGVSATSDVMALVEIDDGEWLGSEILTVGASPEPQEIVVPLVRPLQDDERVERARLHVRNRGGLSAVFGVDFVTLPSSIQLPEARGPWTAARKGSETIQAKGLLAGIDLVGEVDVPHSAELRVDVSLPAGASADPSARVEVEAQVGDRAPEVVSVPLARAWSTLRLPLPSAPPENSTLSLRISTPSEDGALVGRPRLVPASSDALERPPRTVLLITSDTHRADHVGYARRDERLRTPTIDRLAAEGVVFLDATATAPVTGPSHSSIFTGLSVRDTGVHHNLTPLSERADTLAEHFRAAGFRTFAAVSARHLGPQRSGFGQGFERFDAPAVELARDGSDTVEAAVEMLERAEGQDVFLWLHLFDAHVPYRPHAGIVEQYYRGDPRSEDLAPLPPEVRASWDPSVRDEAYLRALYEAEVSYVDQLLARLFDAAPSADRATIAFTSDHGELLGENGSYWTHRPMYPPTLRVPLVLRGAGLPSGVAVQAPVDTTDIGRTLLELAGVESATDFPGRSLAADDAWAPAVPEPRYAVAAGGEAASILFEGWYLLLALDDLPWGGPDGTPRHAARLFRISRDPDCEHDLSREQPEMTRRLRASLVRWLSDAPSGGGLADAPSGDDSEVEDLAALGYAVRESAGGGLTLDPDCGCEECSVFE